MIHESIKDTVVNTDDLEKIPKTACVIHKLDRSQSRSTRRVRRIVAVRPPGEARSAALRRSRVRHSSFCLGSSFDEHACVARPPIAASANRRGDSGVCPARFHRQKERAESIPMC